MNSGTERFLARLHTFLRDVQSLIFVDTLNYNVNRDEYTLDLHL